MLRHPFFGVIDHEDSPGGAASPGESSERRPTASQSRLTQRRTFFAQALAGLAGAGALLWSGRRAEAQDSFNPGGGGAGAASGSFDRGFAGQSNGSFRGGLGGDAFGDPGPRYNGGGGTVTTYAIGEEGSGGGMTTRALGEEGGGRPPSGGVTTYALGEEGSYRPPYRRYYYYRRPRYTTYALGEEGRW